MVFAALGDHVSREHLFCPNQCGSKQMGLREMREHLQVCREQYLEEQIMKISEINV